MLGAVILNPDAYAEVVDLRADDFYVVRHSWIWQAVSGLRQDHQPVDLTTVVTALEQAGQLEEVGGAAYLLQLVNSVPSALHANGYAKAVRDSAARRRLIQAASQIAQGAHDTTLDLDTVTRHAYDAIGEATKAATRLKRLDMREVASLTIDYGLEAMAGKKSELFVTTGIEEVDRLLDYTLSLGHLLGVFGVSEVGKTRFVSEIAFQCQRPVVFFSGETRPQTIVFRQALAMSGLSRADLRRAQQLTNADNTPDDVAEAESAKVSDFLNAVGRLAERPIEWVYPSASVASLTETARAVDAQVIIVDSIRRLSEAHDAARTERFQAIKDTWTALEAMAKENDWLVVAVSERTKEDYGGYGSGKHLYGAQPYEMDHLLHLYDEHTGQKGREVPRTRQIEVTIAKSRHTDASKKAVYEYHLPTQAIRPAPREDTPDDSSDDDEPMMPVPYKEP